MKSAVDMSMRTSKKVLQFSVAVGTQSAGNAAKASQCSTGQNINTVA